MGSGIIILNNSRFRQKRVGLNLNIILFNFTKIGLGSGVVNIFLQIIIPAPPAFPVWHWIVWVQITIIQPDGLDGHGQLTHL